LEKNRAEGAEQEGNTVQDFRFDVAQLRFCHEFDHSRNAPDADRASQRGMKISQTWRRIVLLIG
jgi:hypothetical protein